MRLRRNSISVAVIALVSSMLGHIAASAATPVDILKRALAGSSMPYEGVQETTVYTESGSTTARVRVRGNGHGAVRREFETGPAAGVVILHIASEVWRRSPGGDFVRLPSGGETRPEATAVAIARNYNLSVKAGGTFLGRKTVLLGITPKREYNPSREMLVDEATGLVLRDILNAPGGARRSATVFVKLSYRPQPASQFTKPAVSTTASAGFGPASFESRSSEEEVVRETGRTVPKPKYVPPGYQIATFGVMTTGSGLKTPAVRYSDGLAAFTVFARGAGPGAGAGHGGWGTGAGRRRRGAGGPPWLNRGLTATSDRQQAMVLYTSSTASYVLTGDLTADELSKVARSLP